MYSGLDVDTGLAGRPFQCLVGNQDGLDLKYSLHVSGRRPWGTLGSSVTFSPLLQVYTSSLSPASCSLMSLTGQDGVSLPSSHG